VWFFISLLEFVFIVFLLAGKLRIIQKMREQKREILSKDNIDYDNIIKSSFNSQSLYDSLKKKCHPDRFLEKEKNAIATEIFARIVENKYNYQALQEIKDDAETKLNIKI
jgi:hypothetical protein